MERVWLEFVIVTFPNPVYHDGFHQPILDQKRHVTYARNRFNSAFLSRPNIFSEDRVLVFFYQ